MKKYIIIILCLFFVIHVKSQESVDLSLKLNGDKVISVFNNELILASLTISLPYAEEAKRMNNSIDVLIDELTDSLNTGKLSKAAYEAERDTLLAEKFSEEKQLLGDLSFGENLQLIVTTKGQAVSYLKTSACLTTEWSSAELSSENRVVVHFWLEKTASYNPGSFDIQVTYKESKSNSCKLTIKPQDLPSSIYQDEDFLINQAYSYYVCEDAAKLRNAAERILALNESSISGRTFLADSYLFENNEAEALAHFKEALKYFEQTYPDSYEPPEYLNSMIDYLEDQKK